MKVILLKDINKLGKVGDTKEVADGYAQNYLLPHKFVLPATAANLTLMSERKQKAESLVIASKKEEQELLKKLDGKQVIITKKVTDKNTLFAAVTESEVNTAIAQQLKVDLPVKKIILPFHIKEIGNYTAEIRAHTGKTAKLNIKVVPEQK